MIWRANLIPQYEKYKNEIDSSISKVLNSGRYILGDEVNFFEKEFAEYLGVKHAIGVASGTDALILSLRALGIGKGDEVITTPFTAIPTVSAIISLGATPVFVDVDIDTYLMDISQIKSVISSNTKAIIPVHLFGNVIDINKLKETTNNEIPIIEDTCQAHGSKIDNKFAGSMGLTGAFSFYPTKNLGGYGDGGMIVTDDANIAEKIRMLRMYGMIDYNHININGINSRLDELQAAILRVKLKHLNEMNSCRSRIVDYYKAELDSKYFIHQKINTNVFSNNHIFESRFLGNRDMLIKYLSENSAQSNVYYLIPAHLQKANQFLGYKIGDFPNAELLCKVVIALPLYPEFNKTDQDKVIKLINNFIKKEFND